MKSKSKFEGALKVGGTVEKEVVEAGQLSKAEVRKLTDETVELLLKAGGGEAQEWIDKGRIIDAYVEKLQPRGKFTKPNPFTLLAERDDIPWRASQLRTYREAFRLWGQMGGAQEVPKVDVTTVGLVLTLDPESAKKILNRTVKEKLSTREVAALVKKAKGTEVAEKPERITGDWKALGKAAEAIESELSLMRENRPAMTDFGVIERLEVVLKSIQDLIALICPKDGAQ